MNTLDKIINEIKLISYGKIPYDISIYNECISIIEKYNGVLEKKNIYLILNNESLSYNLNNNLYIISDDEIKDNDYVLNIKNNQIRKAVSSHGSIGYLTSDEIAFLYFNKNHKKIILTNNQALIDDGVQKIDNNFIKYYIKFDFEYIETKKDGLYYELIFPEEIDTLK